MMVESPHPRSHWYIKVSRERLLQLLDEEPFLEIIRLMRAVNSLRFGQHALSVYESAEGNGEGADGIEYPSLTRARNSSFLYLSGLLYEIVVRGPAIGKFYRALPDYERYAGLLEAIKSDTETFEILRTIRDKFTFHFERAEMRKGISAVPHDPFVVLHGYKRTSAELYYELADMTVLAYLIDLHQYEDLADRFDRVIGRTTDYLVEFLTVADRIIGQALKAHGWKSQSCVRRGSRRVVELVRNSVSSFRWNGGGESGRLMSWNR
jgi:hypothetical protein